MLRFATKYVIAPLARLAYRPIVEGVEYLPERGAAIVAANHLSFIDSVVLTLVSPRPIAFLAKAEYFTLRGVKGWLLRQVFDAMGAIPVERGTFRSARASLDLGADVLNAGRIFGIYPEGGRSTDGTLRRGYPGAAWLALATGSPVIPTALVGTDRIQPIGARLPRFHRVTVRFGAPLHFDSSDTRNTPRNRRAVTERIMAEIAALSGSGISEKHVTPRSHSDSEV